MLGPPSHGRALVVAVPAAPAAEGLFEESRALNLLGTYSLDTDIGFAFFDDKKRMHRDLLEDGAAEYLKTMKIEP